MKPKGVYYGLVEAQNLRIQNEEDKKFDDEDDDISSTKIMFYLICLL